MKRVVSILQRTLHMPNVMYCLLTIRNSIDAVNVLATGEPFVACHKNNKFQVRGMAGETSPILGKQQVQGECCLVHADVG